MSLRHAALGLLSRAPGSGYDLLRRFDTTLAHVWPATQSQLYTELNRLAAEGLIEVVATGARGRKEYAITDAGRAELRRWVLTPEEVPLRDPRLLRVFLLADVEPERAREAFVDRLAADRAHLADLEAVLAATDWDEADPGDRYGRIALEFGLRFRRMEVEWERWALERLDEAPPPA